MEKLRYLNCRYNNLKNSGIPENLLKREEMVVLDLSHNQLKQIPAELDKSKKLLVLNLSYNQIESVPPQMFVSLNQLIFLDLSNNCLGEFAIFVLTPNTDFLLESIPPQLRRLTCLKTLNLSHNPLGQNQLRQLPSLTSMETLHLRNTQRSFQNLPTALETLEILSDVDLGQNDLLKVPTLLFSLPNLKRINLSDNQISDLPQDVGDFWKSVEFLNLSRNRLKALPASVCRMSKLRRLYLAENQLDFEGIPSGIGKLVNLEVFSAPHNNLEMIPEGVVRCGRLKKLILSHNRLITLPDAIHLLNDIETLDLSGNPDLIMPPKPTEYQFISRGSGIEFYNIDFSLNTQLQLAGAAPPPNLLPPTPPVVKDATARKRRLRMRQKEKSDEDAETKQAKVLKGMSELVKEKEKLMERENRQMEANLKPKRWDEALERPPLDYSDFFDPDAGQTQGLTVYEIENFLPNEVDSALHGKFYEGDCYIILQTILDEKENFDYRIYYWIGAEASLDKKACSAIHAVNLRNYLGARCRTIREEQGEESDEFLALFPQEIVYVEGGRTASGFFTVEETEFTHRMYRLHELQTNRRQLYLEPVDMSSVSLDSRYVFLVDAGQRIFIWNGSKAKNTMKQKARLLAEKIAKEERKNKSQLIFCNQGAEEDEFWDELVIPDDQIVAQVIDHLDPETYQPKRPIIYQVVLGMGYLELPQLDYKKLTPSVLETKCVYIIDTYSDLFIWLGRKSARLVKAAALKLGQEVHLMMKRPSYGMVHRCLEGNEPQLLKSKFEGWNDVIPVDFTRTAESVSRTGADLVKWMSGQEVKADLQALFMPRQPPMTKEEARQLMEEFNDDLDVMKAFVLEGKKFTKLPEQEMGHFYSEGCYVYLCKYWLPLDDESLTSSQEGDDEESESDFQCTVYFWQGRDASNMGWLTFTFTLQKEFKARFGDKLEVVRTHQQQENMKFLSHFKQRFIIHQGKRPPPEVDPEFLMNQTIMYQLRSNNSPLTVRCVQVKADAVNLSSGFCFLIKVPSDEPVIYVWIGWRSDEDEARLAEEIAVNMFDEKYRVTIINEGEEDAQFWQVLGGQKPYEEDSSYMQYTRLFRCSNDKGYFSISEKCPDFCQDDLSDEDIMILDNGSQTFIWVGSRSSDVEIKLAYKSAQVYVQNMRIKQPDRPRVLMLTFKGKESKKFSKCFHGWSRHKTLVDPRAHVKLLLDNDDNYPIQNNHSSAPAAT